MNKYEKATSETSVLILLNLSRGAKSRKRILVTLLSGPKNCSQIAKELSLNWWTVQKHIQYLVKENIVVDMNFGRIKFYRLTAKSEEITKTIQAEDTLEMGLMEETSVQVSRPI